VFDLLPRACPECGASVTCDEQDDHVCDEGQRTPYEHFQIRLEIERFDDELRDWLVSPAGRFAVFYAERERAPARLA